MSLSAKEARAYHATPGESTRSHLAHPRPPHPGGPGPNSVASNTVAGRARPAWIALGANLGDPRTALLRALRWLDALPHTRLEAASSLHRTAAYDPDATTPQPDYLNAVARVSTALTPHALMRALLVLERAAGRVRSRPNGPRTLDLDLLLFGSRGALTLETPDLVLPHPRLHLRRFVLAPLSELDPDLEHPHLHRSMRSLLEAL